MYNTQYTIKKYMKFVQVIKLLRIELGIREEKKYLDKI